MTVGAGLSNAGARANAHAGATLIADDGPGGRRFTESHGSTHSRHGHDGGAGGLAMALFFHVATGGPFHVAISNQADSTSNAATSRSAALISTPIRCAARPGARYLSA